MGKKPRGKRPGPAQEAHASAKASKGRWALVPLIAFLLGTALGFVVGYEAGDGGAQMDAFGRPPGHPHYQHRHP